MEASVLHNQLKANQLNDFYVFTGPEWVVQNKYIERICKLSGLEQKRIENLSDEYNKIKNPTVLTKSYMYVLRDDKELLGTEKLHTEIQRGVLGKNILVLLLTSVDKRTKFYKTFKDIIYEFEPLKPNVLRKYLQKEISLSDESLDELMSVCEYDYGRCLLEIDKIKCYANQADMDGYDMNPNEALSDLLKDRTIHVPPYDAIFDFVDAVLGRKRSKWNLYEQCKAIGEAPMVMITVLYDNAKAALQVRSYEGKDIAQGTGLAPWQIKNASRYTSINSNRDFLDIMDLCRRCEQGIKKGFIDECFAMDYILANI